MKFRCQIVRWNRFGRAGEIAQGRNRRRQHEVEEILDDRKRHGRREFLVKWKGYEIDDASWEPRVNLNAEDGINVQLQEYLRLNPDADDEA